MSAKVGVFEKVKNVLFLTSLLAYSFVGTNPDSRFCVVASHSHRQGMVSHDNYTHTRKYAL